MKLRSLTDSPRYTKFVQERDRGLEHVLVKYSVMLSAVIVVLRRRAEEIAVRQAVGSVGKEQFKRQREQFERSLTPYFDMAIDRTVALIKSLRKSTYIIACAGQAEAIGRALGVNTKFQITRKDLHDVETGDMQFGGSLYMRVELGYHRLLRDVVDAYQLTQVLESPTDEIIEKISRAFPKGTYVSRKRRVMAKMAEAGKSKSDKISMSFGEIEEDDWNDALKDYLEDELPFGRAPHDKMFYVEHDDSGDLIEEDSYFRYQWQVEQDMTNDFIDQVRAGENDAANQNGIDTFQWIAIVDSKTDECCTDRDGLTVDEIEAKLDSGEINDDCDASVAPAHFNCRCRMAPMTTDFPEESPPDFGSFDDWLEEKKAA